MHFCYHSFATVSPHTEQSNIKNQPLFWPIALSLLLANYTMYVVDTVSPPRPVQLVWKNSPRGLSIRSYVCAPK